MMGTDRSFSRKALLRNLHTEITLGEGGEMLGMIFTGDGCSSGIARPLWPRGALGTPFLGATSSWAKVK